MSLIQTLTDVEYPETDGKPMGETDLHRSWMIRLFDWLDYRYRGQQVYIACDLLLYFEDGSPHQYVVPDVFVVKDCKSDMRRVFKTWEEGQLPNVVFEVTSRSTRNEDTAYKPQVYQRIGVKELFLYDPTSDYLSPALQGYRLEGNVYTKLTLDNRESLECRQLGFRLCLEDARLVMYDSRTGEPLRTEAEAERAAREAAERKAAEETEARRAAEVRADAEAEARRSAEEELRRLRDQLRQQREEP